VVGQLNKGEEHEGQDKEKVYGSRVEAGSRCGLLSWEGGSVETPGGHGALIDEIHSAVIVRQIICQA
jgi:hypothetical protein